MARAITSDSLAPQRPLFSLVEQSICTYREYPTTPYFGGQIYWDTEVYAFIIHESGDKAPRTRDSVYYQRVSID